MNISSVNYHLKSVPDNLLLTVSHKQHLLIIQVLKKYSTLDVPAVLDAKQKEILESKSMMITNIRTDDKGLDHCEIFGF